MDNPATDHGGPVTRPNSILPKPALRALLRRTRADYGARPLPVPPAFLAMLRPGLIVATYVAVNGEADPEPLAVAALDRGCSLALPHIVDRATPLRFLAWDRSVPLDTGPFGLRQPAAGGPEVVPDIILTPLLGFDRSGNRLGQGAGHYDRAFTAHPHAQRVGIAYACQETPLVPDAWDVPLHAVVTDNEWIAL